MKPKRLVTLKVFVKGSSNPDDLMPGCANYDHHYGGCVFAETCKVLDGERCGWFERAVLPTAADIGQRDHVYALYEQTTGALIDRNKTRRKTGDVRPCPDCGSALRPRQRYCDACSKKRKRAASRERRLNHGVQSRALTPTKPSEMAEKAPSVPCGASTRNLRANVPIFSNRQVKA